MLSALLVMAAIAVALGAVLGFAAIKFRVEGNPLVDKIDSILPQTSAGNAAIRVVGLMRRPSRRGSRHQ